MNMKSKILKEVVSLNILKNGLHKRLQSTAVYEAYEAARPYDEIPHPRGLPIIKNMGLMLSKEMAESFIDVHRKLVKDHGEIYRIRLPGKDMVCLADPRDGRTLIDNDGPTPMIAGFELFEAVRKGPLKDEFANIGLAGTGEDWLKFRQAVQQDMMRPKSALYYIDDLSSVMDDVNDKLELMLDENSDTVNLNETIQEFALEAIGVIFIGTRLGVLQGKEDGQRMIHAATRIFILMIDLIVIPPAIHRHLPIYKEFVECSRTMLDISRKHIMRAIAQNKKDGSLEGTILSKLVKRCGEDSDIPIVMAVDALSAGIDTTGNAALFLLYQLASNPEKQEMLYQEIVDVVGKEGKMSEAKLSEMRFLKACLQESMRMTPIANATARITTSDMVLRGYQIPKGTMVLRHNVLLSNDPQIFSQADEFLPERWIRGSPLYKKTEPFANLPFGHGKRSCIGQRFARLELYMLAFKIIQQYKIEYHGPPVTINYKGLGKPSIPLKLKMRKRSV